ncbi:MAG: toprim domain-containing protein [Bacilli bacterium]
MSSLSFKNVQEMINQLAIKEKLNYFICECPECNGKEAYVYKSNLNKLKCSRENECGAEIEIKYVSKEADVVFEEDKELSKRELKMSSTLTNFYDNHIKKEYFPGFEYRGLEINILKEADVLLSSPDTKFEIDFKDSKVNVFETNMKDLQSRTAKYDMIFPIKNDDGQITRLVYRSINDEQYVKEYPKTIVQKSSDVLKLNMDNEIIIVSESILDGLSIKQSYDAGLYACRGITKARGLCYELSNNRGFWQNKTLLIGFDNDEAGYKYAAEVVKKCNELEIECIPLQVPGNMKDWNEVLQSYSKEYISSNIDQQIREVISNYLNFGKVDGLISLSTKHLNTSMKNEFLQAYYLNAFSSQLNVGPINALVLDLQYENSFYADIDTIKSITKSNDVNLKDFDCKLLQVSSIATFTTQEGIVKPLNEANFHEQKLLQEKKIDINHEVKKRIVSSRLALSKDMVDRSINYQKSNIFCVELLKKYDCEVKFNENALYDFSKKDSMLEISSTIANDKIFRVLTKELIHQNKELNKDLIESSHQFFLSNFKRENINFNPAITSIEDVRLVMKNNHALVKFFELNNLFEYNLEDVVSEPKKGLEKGKEGSDLIGKHNMSTIFET